MQRIRALLERDEPVTWLFNGDSITHANVHVGPARDYVQLFETRIRDELARMRDHVLRTAISGNTTRELLADFDWRVARFRPDAVFLMIGMNDCSTIRERPVSLETFTANLNEFADRVEAFGGLLLLQTTCPIMPGTAPDREPQFPAFMDAIRAVARERELPLVDHEAWWRELGERTDCWMGNAFHPNHYGHLAFARKLFADLGIADPDAPTGRYYLI
jgi:lysophospholipase L1-like esterase